MNRCISLPLCAVLLCAVMPRGMASQQSPHFGTKTDRPFAFVVDSKLVSVNGTDTDNRPALEGYTETHLGSYLVFEERGALYLEKDATTIAELERLYAPMRPLNAQQRALQAIQKPLERQMKALGEKMRSAQTPQQQTELGAEMRQIGERMERTGKEQGSVGEQQGKVGKAFYDRAQAIFVQCLQNGSCRPA